MHFFPLMRNEMYLQMIKLIFSIHVYIVIFLLFFIISQSLGALAPLCQSFSMSRLLSFIKNLTMFSQWSKVKSYCALNRLIAVDFSFFFLLSSIQIEESIGFVQIFDIRFLMDLHVLGCLEHCLTISGKCLCMCDKNFVTCVSSRTNQQNLMKFHI